MSELLPGGKLTTFCTECGEVKRWQLERFRSFWRGEYDRFCSTCGRRMYRRLTFCPNGHGGRHYTDSAYGYGMGLFTVDGQRHEGWNCEAGPRPDPVIHP